MAVCRDVKITLLGMRLAMVCVVCYVVRINNDNYYSSFYFF